MPSIVYGMWGLLVFAPILSAWVQQPLQGAFSDVPLLGALFSGPPVGIGLLSAGIILAIMVIPFIARGDARRVRGHPVDAQGVRLRARLHHLGGDLEGGAAVHQDRRDRRHHARPGRALGETMAVTFVIGNFNQLNSLSLFEAANSITSALANEFAEANEGLHQASLMYLGLVLFFITFVVLALSKLLLSQLKKGEGKVA